MVVFFMVAVTMVLAALFVVVRPLLREARDTSDDRDRQNRDIAKQRIRDLRDQFDDDVIDDQELARATAEIEQAFLDEIGAPDDRVRAGAALKSPWAAIVVSTAVPVLAGILYLLLGQPGAIEFEPTAATEPQGHGQATDVAQMVDTLKRRLIENPGDVEGWYLLGNSYMSMRQYATAAEVFEKLRRIVGDDPDVLIRQADALAMANGNRLNGAPEALIQRALEGQPDHPTALWLAGISAQQRGQPEAALDYWERVKPQFADNPRATAELNGMIDQVRQQMAVAGEAAAVTQTGPTASIRVTVTLDPSMIGKALPGDTVFVLARAVAGPPMPLAVARRQVSELPMQITLDDSMAMMPAMTLSSFDRVRVVAKISKSGDATTRAGDLIGESPPLTPGKDLAVTVAINKIAE